MADEKLTDKKTLSVIVIVAVAILIGTIIHIDIIYGRPKHPSTIPYWIFSYTTYVGFNLAILTYWLKIGRKKETEETFSVKKILAIVVLTTMAVVPGCALYFVIILLTYPFIGFYSVILSLSIIVVPLLLATAYTLKTRKKRPN